MIYCLQPQGFTLETPKSVDKISYIIEFQFFEDSIGLLCQSKVKVLYQFIWVFFPYTFHVLPAKLLLTIIPQG
jgi:hypothetical protein